MIRFYKADDKLIQYNSETDVYKIRNTISTEDKRISKEAFLQMKAQEIKRQDFSKLMNVYFKDIKHSWVYEGTPFRKLDNFDKECSIWNKVPKHNLKDSYYGSLLMVYHWGRIYYLASWGSYAPQAQLVEPSTLQTVRWINIKNCAPIFNEQTKKIV